MRRLLVPLLVAVTPFLAPAGDISGCTTLAFSGRPRLGLVESDGGVWLVDTPTPLAYW
jgi:hypothetical protein